MKKLIDILNFSEEYLKKYSFSKPKLEAQKVVSYVLKLDRISLYANFDRNLTEDERTEIKVLLREMARKRRNFDELDSVHKKDDAEAAREAEDHRLKNMEILKKSIAYLEGKGVENARFEAESIFAHVLKTGRMTLTLNFKREIRKEELEEIRGMLKERAVDKRPLAYILGDEEFYGYKFNVDERVLIPRSETELLVKECIGLLYGVEEPVILDIGIGSGAISISLAKEIERSKVLGVDISDGAIEVANSNKELNEADNVKFMKSDVFSNVKYTEFDLIVSNPPYIPTKEYVGLMPEVKGHEPKMALTDNGDGYKFYTQISEESGNYLKAGGYLAFEVGYDQAPKVKELMEENDFENVVVVRDYHNIERIVIGKKK